MLRIPKILLAAALLSFVVAAPVPAAQPSLSSQEKEWLSHATRSEREGWIYLHQEDGPRERGFQQGYLLAPEIEKCLQTERYETYWSVPRDFDFFVAQGKILFDGKIPEEQAEELRGMALGLERAGIEGAGYDVLVAHNAYIELVGYWWPWAREKEAERVKNISLGGCSSFVATGSWTADGGVVLAHNTWFSYSEGALCNLVLDVAPEKGFRMIMQSVPGCIHSATDFFVCSSGIVGSETTIGGFSGYDPSGTPEFCRVRKAMQYAGSLDEWAKILLEGNNGAYANSWLLGDVRTGEIARLELGLKHHKFEKTKDGYYCGSNIAEDRDVLLDETNLNFSDIRLSAVSRRLRWHELLKENRSKITVESAKAFLADHYDSYLQREHPGCRSLCGHHELETGETFIVHPPFRPGGAVDGKAVDTRLAREMSFWARWGNSCGIPFTAAEYLAQHPQYEWLRGYLPDRPTREWVVFEETGKK